MLNHCKTGVCPRHQLLVYKKHSRALGPPGNQGLEPMIPLAASTGVTGDGRLAAAFAPMLRA